MQIIGRHAREYAEGKYVRAEQAEKPPRKLAPVDPEAEYLTVPQVAEGLSASEDTIISAFEGRPGVIDMGSAEAMHKRKKRMLRIPRFAIADYAQEKQVKERRRKSR